MKDLDLSKPDTELIPQLSEFSNLLCALKFRTNRKANFDEMLNRAKRADVYRAALIGKTKAKVEIHFAAFMKTRDGALRARIMLEEMRISGWKPTLFANGQIHSNLNSLNNMLTCHARAAHLPDSKANCRETRVLDFTEPDFRTSLTYSMMGKDDREQDRELWFSPCSHISSMLQVSRLDGVSPEARFTAKAFERTCNLCPLFEGSGFRKIKSIGTEKKYW